MSEQIQLQARALKQVKELPRGIRRRGSSYVAYLTRPDGTYEKRSLGNISLGLAVKQRAKWQLEMAEGKYVKKVPRREHVTFGVIADAMLEQSKRYKRSWATDAGCVKRMKEWWKDSFADEITTKMIDDKLYENVAPRELAGPKRQATNTEWSCRRFSR